MFYICPLTGNFCVSPKNNPIDVNGMSLNVCENCSQAVESKKHFWEQTVKKVLSQMKVDKILSQEEIDNVVANIKSREELSVFLHLLKQQHTKNIEMPSCPCGTPLYVILKNQKAGCENCFMFFYTTLSQLLDQVQQIARKQSGSSNELFIQDLKNKMEKAIKEERYEEAASIRDKINKVKINEKDS